MCSFRSCQTRFEFLSQFRKVRNAFECFVTQVQTRLPKTKCVWPMKINVICTVVPDVLFNCVCWDSVNDWRLKHSSTIAWYMDVADSSYIAVCYDCLWLIDHSRVLISLFYNGIVCFLTEFKGLRCGRMLNGTMSAGGLRCSCACLRRRGHVPPGEIYGL